MGTHGFTRHPTARGLRIQEVFRHKDCVMNHLSGIAVRKKRRGRWPSTSGSSESPFQLFLSHRDRKRGWRGPCIALRKIQDALHTPVTIHSRAFGIRPSGGGSLSSPSGRKKGSEAYYISGPKSETAVGATDSSSGGSLEVFPSTSCG